MRRNSTREGPEPVSQDAALPPRLDRVSTGMPGLDAVTGGGFLQSGVYILQGAPGAGKTILANQVVHHHAAAGGARRLRHHAGRVARTAVAAHGGVLLLRPVLAAG